MLKSFIWCVILGLSLSGCSTHLAMAHKDKYDTSVAMDELRIELSDIKHTLNNTQVELQILDEKVKTQDVSLQRTKQGSSSGVSSLDQKVYLLEKRLSQIEKGQEKIVADMKQFSTQYKSKVHDLEQELTAQNKLLQEISELKSTLSSISQAIKGSSASAETYKVKSGDSLEKIARLHHTTVEALKKANGLSSTKIVIGQEIKIPHAQP